MLRVDMEYDIQFEHIYNRFNATPNGKLYLHLSGISRDKLDVSTMSKQFFSDYTSDMSVDPNSNVGQNKSFNTYTSEITKGLLRLNGYYLMWKFLKDMYGQAEADSLLTDSIKGYFYPHDLTKWSIPYCIAMSTLGLIVEGRPYGHLHSLPPKRSDSYVSQVIESVMDMSQEMAGAIAVADLIVNYAWFLNREVKNVLPVLKGNKELKKKVINDLQRFVHVVNNAFRTGGDSPFTNISLYDKETLLRVFSSYTYPDGSKATDLADLIIEIEKIFMEFIAKKDPKTGLPYRFPIVTVNLFLDKGSSLDDEFVRLVSEHNREGVFNIFVTSDNVKIASCCRLINDIKKLAEYKGIDSFGNGGLNIGSHRVVTVNLPRLARRCKDLKLFMKSLDESFHGAAKILSAHRELIRKRIDNGFLKFFKPLGWLNLDRMFYSTIGISGLWESMKYLDIDVIHQANEVAEVLSYITDLSQKLTLEFGVPFNIEQTPAEGAAVNLASKDRIYFGDNPYPIYSNQFIPLWENVDIPTRARIDGKLSSYFSGGSISHLNIGSKATPTQMKKLIKFAVDNGLEHFALNPQFCVCEDGHVTLSGNADTCSQCGKKIVSHYTRVVGYFTPVGNWVKARREFDFPLRKYNYM
jgi:ribonucleoside-triphosphate reductase